MLKTMVTINKIKLQNVNFDIKVVLLCKFMVNLLKVATCNKNIGGRRHQKQVA